MLASFVFQIKDHRRKQGRRYQLGHILLFAIFAIASNADSYRKIHSFIKRHYVTLNHVFGLNWKRLPAYTTVRNIIQGTSSSEIEAQFRAYRDQFAPLGAEHQVIHFDGKVVRGSFDHFKDQKAIQVLSAFLDDSQLILAHEEIAAKTNEIPTAQTLIQELGLSDSLFTFDALHCQQETLQTAKATGNEVVVQVKKNQPTLLNDCHTVSGSRESDAVYQEPLTKTRNRLEQRQVEVFLKPDLTQADKWQEVATLVKVTRFREEFETKTRIWKDTSETAFYISTTVLSAEEFCRVIRGHWGIENRNHHVKDVSMREDRSRIRVNPHIFAKLRSFALNLLRMNGVKNVQLELFENCMNLDRVLNYVGVMS
jgi:predicted transposase YbfD/YdcC